MTRSAGRSVGRHPRVHCAIYTRKSRAILWNVYVNALRSGISDWPNPGRSGAMTRNRSASPGTRSRNIWLALGKPCSNSSVCASLGPASRYKILKPSTSAFRKLTLCMTGLALQWPANAAHGSCIRQERFKNRRSTIACQEVVFGGAEARQVTDRFIPEISAFQLQADRVSDKRSSNKYKFRAQLTDISALQEKPPRKDTKS